MSACFKHQRAINKYFCLLDLKVEEEKERTLIKYKTSKCFPFKIVLSSLLQIYADPFVRAAGEGKQTTDFSCRQAGGEGCG